MTTTFTHGYALLIGVGTTAYDPWSLPVTVNDVRTLHKLLVTPDLCGYLNDEAHILMLTDSAATQDGILAGLTWLRDRVTLDSEATALVYYSGHGWLDKVTGKYYLIHHNADPREWPDSFLLADTFAAALEMLHPKRLLVFLDCCHAAGIVDKSLYTQLSNLRKSVAFPKGLTDKLAQGEGRAVFASSRGEEPSQYRPDEKLSIYTQELLAALQGAGNRPGDTYVGVSNLMTHLGRAVPLSAQKLCNAVQTPVFKFETEDFPIALLRGGKGLPMGGWEMVEDEAWRTIERIIIGSGAVVAREIHAPVAVQGSIAAQGSVTIVGDMLTNNNRVDLQKGGIRAQHIESQNVVDGVMASLEALQHEGKLGELARDIERGGISAETIKARNVVSGLYVPSAETLEELRREVVSLREQVQVADAAGEIMENGDVHDVLNALEIVEAELMQSEPRGQRVTRKLEEAAAVLTGVAEAATAAGKVGLSVVKLAPVAMMLWKLAEAML